MKLGIIRCMQTEDYCPGTADFCAVAQRAGAFRRSAKKQNLSVLRIAAGCLGKKAVLRVRELVRRGADTIALASCISKGTPVGYPCPFAEKMKELIVREAPNIRIIEYTH